MGFLSIRHLLVMTCILPSLLCFAQSEEGMEYERNSMHVMMIKRPNQKFDDVIEEVFRQMPFPERFNDHNLGVRAVSFAESEEDQSRNIASFIKQVNLGQKMVAKWFNRDKQTGSFNVDLIKERGFYNASQGQKNIARASIRGMALLEDAGENLISKTFLLVSDISYKSKGSATWIIKFYLNAFFGNIKGSQDAMQSIGGFSVDIKSYLFQLKWDNETAHEFYSKYYTEDGNSDIEKVKAFAAERNLFRMEYIGQTENISSEVNFAATKDPKEQLIRVCRRTLDKNIAQLQHTYEDFQIKAPLLSTDPLSADVGLKEDITEQSRFEVLERILNEDGTVSYERVGIIKPQKGKIKDNRYQAEEDLSATEFVKVSGKDFFPGMLIREIK